MAPTLSVQLSKRGHDYAHQKWIANMVAGRRSQSPPPPYHEHDNVHLGDRPVMLSHLRPRIILEPIEDEDVEVEINPDTRRIR
jgi:hypothetical protein